MNRLVTWIAGLFALAALGLPGCIWPAHNAPWGDGYVPDDDHYSAVATQIEVPELSGGCLDEPAQILDSWGLIACSAGGRERLIRQLGVYRDLMDDGVPIVLNMYLDPADIAGDEGIIAALGRFGTLAASENFASLPGID